MTLHPSAASTLLLVLVLAGCGAPKQAEGTPPIPAARGDAASRPPDPAPRGDVGLLPLPSRQQVVNSVALGRRDPFASVLPPALPPSAGAAGSGAAPGAAGPGSGGLRARTVRPALPVLPQGFRLTGVMRSGGRSEAVVVVDDPQGNPLLSGNLRPGDRGGHSTDLLPPGWSVASIDVNRGSITLLRGGQPVVAEL